METGAGEMRLGGVVDTSTIDWYGNVSLVVFFAGCNFRCPYCHNAGLIPMDSGESLGADYLRMRLEEEKNLLDSIVLSGGEPLLQPEGIRTACSVAKDAGLKIMLNTNGSRPKVIEALINDGLIDRIALDVKAPLNPESYSAFLGAEPGNVPSMVKRSLEICKERGVEVEARTTIAPGLSDEPGSVKAIEEDVGGLCDLFVLQQFDNIGEVLSPDMKSRKPHTRETLVDLAGVASDAGMGNVYIKTRRSGLERIR